MSLPSFIVDGYGTGHKVRVNGEGEINVVVHPHPPRDEVEVAFPFRQYLTDDGTPTGSNDMKVNGATTPVEFCVNAVSDFDIYVKNIAIVIADAGASLSQFGSITALTNGVDIKWVSQDFGERTIASGLKSNFDFVQTALGQPAFGDGNGAFRANNVVSTSEAFLPVIDLSKTFGLPWGVRLRKGTKDRLCFVINDNVSTIDRFDALAYGIEF